ncbi:MAG: anti-sigma factor family protein [Polyangiales bacterium]
MMDCQALHSQLDAYVDAELEASQVIELEQHLDECGACRNELALARLLQQGVRALPKAATPAGLERRLARALDEMTVGEGRSRSALRSPLGQVLGVAALISLVVGAALRSDSSNRGGRENVSAADIAPLGVLGDIVARHVDQLPADIAAERPEQVATWSRGKVGFRVRSIEFAEPQVRLVGARISHIGAQPALKLYYRVGNVDLTTVEFQAPPSPISLSFGAHRERFGSRVVTYHNVHGYTVPIVEQDGIAYAFTGDLDQRRLLQLVASARLP